MKRSIEGFDDEGSRDIPQEVSFCPIRTSLGDFGEYLITLQTQIQCPQVQGVHRFLFQPPTLASSQVILKLEAENYEWQLDRRIWLLLRSTPYSPYSFLVFELNAMAFGRKSRLGAPRLRRLPLCPGTASPSAERGWRVVDRAPSLFPLSHRGQTTLMPGPPFQVPVCASGSSSRLEDKISGTVQTMQVSVVIFLQKREDPRKP